ncbi:YlqD family protein [Numidum massiliense]|uniref:YlqD family protein n=1 Tax=Numidum massiliense TaxID=1522315 RepID=UPI0006D55B9F|nr:YlqD family protein [Numidum massiliense]
MRIKRPVTVKLLVTEHTKNDLLKQCEQALRQLELELEQLSFERRKLLHRAEKHGREALQQAEERLNDEVSSRQEKMERLRLQYAQIEKLAEGSEIIHSQVDSEVDVTIGDNWDELMRQTEIVLKDGFVHDIRQGGTT